MSKKAKHSIVTEDVSVKTTQSRKKILSHMLILISMLLIYFACSKNGEDIIIDEDVIDEEEIIDGVACSELGMIPNDDTKGSSNRTILINALKEGTNILVDNKYYLTGLGTASQIESDIVIVGITENAEFSFIETMMTSSNFIRVAGQNLLMRRIRFTTKQNELVYAFRLSDAHKMESMAFENCYFEGPIRLVSWGYTGSVYPDPDQDDYGIEKFKFINNACNNISKTFIAVPNVPIKHSQIVKNRITNFSGIFYNQEITNANIHVDKVAPKMAYLEVKDNTVINDASWDAIEYGSGLTYHCFIFFEGDRCDYKNNHVEGLHHFDQEITIYDAYFNCINLEYENNFWKNNITFNSDPNFTVARQLMKCKDAPRLDGYKNIKRVCRNNIFIVEKSYAAQFNRDPEELWVKIIEFDNDMESVVVENNTIDVYILRLNSSAVKTHNFTFSGNTIHAVKTLNRASNAVLSISVTTNDGISGTYIARNNKVTIDEPGSSPIRGNSLINYSITTGNIDHVKVIFEDNYVSWPDMKAIVRSTYTIRIGDLPMDISIKDNTVITESEPEKMTGINGGTIDITENTFIVTGGV